MVHMMNVASEINNKIDEMDSLKRTILFLFGFDLLKNELWKKTQEVENDQAKKGLINTAWSYEDAPSNFVGLLFIWKYYNNKSKVKLSDAIKQFLTELGASEPIKAPNWNEIPNKENTDQSPLKINKSFNPIYLKKD